MLSVERLSLLSLLFFSVNALAAAPVRVGLRTRAAEAVLGEGEYRIESLPDRQVKVLRWRAPVRVTVGSKGLRFDGEELGPRLRLAATDGRPIVLEGKPYRGEIELLGNGRGQLTAVNLVDVEDYARGILVHEANPSWPAEALRAQAVISRTYALRNRGRHGGDGYDFCPTSHCQVYGGQSAERATTDAAVTATRDVVLVYKGKLVSAVFHSACGGSTAGAEEVWDSDGAPYLRAVPCRFCRGTKHDAWTVAIDGDELSARLTTAGHNVGRVKAVRVASRSPSGRAKTVQIRGADGTLVLQANRFRLLADARRLKSVFWRRIRWDKGSWVFEGQGWGHGVGLCQWGMKVLADRRWNHPKILRFYYHGTTLARMRE